MMALLSQSLYYLPSILAHLVALGAAAFLFTRARVAALLLAGGTALQLLASVVSFGGHAWMSYAYEANGWTAAQMSMWSSAIGLLASLVRALGELVVVGAVVAAVVAVGRAAPDLWAQNGPPK